MYELGYTDEQVDEANRAATNFMEMIGELANERRTRPQDDLISDLVQVTEQGELLTEDELRATCIFLLMQGTKPRSTGRRLGCGHCSRIRVSLRL